MVPVTAAPAAADRAGRPARRQAPGRDLLVRAGLFHPVHPGHQLAERGAGRAIRAGRHPVGYGEVGLGQAEPLRRGLAQHPPRRRRRAAQQRRGVRHGPAAERAQVERGHAGVAHQHPDRPGRHPQFLGHQQRQRAPGPLPGLHLAGEGRHHPVRPHVQPGPRASGQYARGRFLPGHADQALGQPGQERAGIRGDLIPGPGPGAGHDGRLGGQDGHWLQRLRLLHQLGRPVDRRPDPRVGAAPAEVPGQFGGDPGVVGVRDAGQQRRAAGEPAGGAVAALQCPGLHPGLLHRVQQAVLGQAFHRRDLVPGGLTGRGGARCHGPAAQQHRAGAAGALAAAQLRSGDAQLLAEYLEQAAFRPGSYLTGDAIDGDHEPRFHHGFLSTRWAWITWSVCATIP